jgi:hypothetical protein
VGRPEAYPFRVLLRTPEATTIPILALGVEAQREQVECKLCFSTREALARVVSGNLSRALEGRHGDHRLLNVRRRVGRRVAIYSSWLALTDQIAAEALVNDHPGLGFAGIEKRIEAEFRSREEKLKAAVARGRYDLGRLDHRHGKWRAREYFTEAETLDKLEWSRVALTCLRESLAADPDGVCVG